MPDRNGETRKLQGGSDVPMVDFAAAQRIREMRESQGLSPEALAAAVKEAAETAPWGNRGAVDAHTIRRIEKTGHVPGPRVQFVIANFFGVVLHDLWEPRRGRVAA
jgi:ribosome-binding protein aMBF1 (putative translation factor)